MSFIPRHFILEGKDLKILQRDKGSFRIKAHKNTGVIDLLRKKKPSKVNVLKVSFFSPFEIQKQRPIQYRGKKVSTMHSDTYK